MNFEYAEQRIKHIRSAEKLCEYLSHEIDQYERDNNDCDIDVVIAEKVKWKLLEFVNNVTDGSEIFL